MAQVLTLIQCSKLMLVRACNFPTSEQLHSFKFAVVKKVVLNTARLLSVGSYLVVVGKAHGHHIGKALLTCSYTTKYSFSNAGQLLCSVSTAGQSSCNRKPGNWIHKGLEIWYGEWLALHRIPAGMLYGWNHYYTVNAISSSRAMVTLERNILRLRSNCN